MSRAVQFCAALLVTAALAAALSQQARPEEKPPAAGSGGLLGAARRAQAASEGGAAPSRTLEEAAAAHGLKVPADRNIEVALRKPTKFDFADTALSDVVDFFANQFDINIQLDNKGLADAAVDPSAPITRSLRKVISFESALRLILEDLDLTFVIQDEVLKITSKEKADEILTTKVYPVDDLLGGRRNWGPLMQAIKSSIQPDSWDDNGGPGSMQPFNVGSLLVVSQKRDVHDEVRELLAQLRAELPGADIGARNAARQTTTTAVYHLGGASPEQTAEALKKLVAPESWEGQGGRGLIFVVSRTDTRPGGGPVAPQTSGALLIQQTAEVQNDVYDLLRELAPQQGFGRKGGMVGAFGGAIIGVEGMGGGIGGAGGGNLSPPAAQPAKPQ
jgi:hypothetical protein